MSAIDFRAVCLAKKSGATTALTVKSLALAFSQVNQLPATLLCAAPIGADDDHERIVELRKAVGGVWLTLSWASTDSDARFAQKAVLVGNLPEERMAWLCKQGLVATAVVASTPEELLRGLRAEAEAVFELEWVERMPMTWIQAVIKDVVLHPRQHG